MKPSTLKIRLPYHHAFQDAEIPTANLSAILSPADDSAEAPSTAEQRQRVAAALNNPIGSLKLEELAKGKRNATLITSDHTRPVPGHLTLPILLERLRRGNPDIDISILVATGCHRATSANEMCQKLGADVVSHEKFVMHDCTNAASVRHVGTLPSGGDLWLNQLAGYRSPLETATTLQEALAMALKTAGPAARIVVIPDGVSVIVK